MRKVLIMRVVVATAYSYRHNNVAVYQCAFKPLSVLVGLLGDEGVEDAGIEVVDLHCGLHFGEGAGGNLTRGESALAKDFVDVRNVLLELVPALTDRGEGVFKNGHSWDISVKD